MMKKRIAALALSASLATTAVLAPQADARGGKGGPKKNDAPAIFKLSSFKKDDKKKNNKKNHKSDKLSSSKNKKNDWKKKNKKDNKKSSYNLKGFHSSSKDGGKKHNHGKK